MKRFGVRPTSTTCLASSLSIKLDREGADFYRVLEEIGPRLAADPVAIQIPVGQGPAHTSDPFRAVIDLIDMKMLTFSKEDFAER